MCVHRAQHHPAQQPSGNFRSSHSSIDAKWLCVFLQTANRPNANGRTLTLFDDDDDDVAIALLQLFRLLPLLVMIMMIIWKFKFLKMKLLYRMAQEWEWWGKAYFFFWYAKHSVYPSNSPLIIAYHFVPHKLHRRTLNMPWYYFLLFFQMYFSRLQLTPTRIFIFYVNPWIVDEVYLRYLRCSHRVPFPIHHVCAARACMRSL